MRAAGERRGAEVGLGEHRRRGRDMAWRCRVRRAGESDLGVGERERVRRAAFDQRQRLQRLDRGTRVDRRIDFAERQRNRAVGVDHGRCAAMARFDTRAACDFDHDGVGQGSGSIGEIGPRQPI